MPFVDVARLTLRQNRRGSIGWIAGLAAITTLYVSSYQSVAATKAAVIANYPESLRRALNLQDFTSPAGYLNSTVYGIPLLLLTTVFVISSATRAVAGDEESGALDLLLSHPISRTSLVVGRMLSMVTVLLGLGIVVFAVVLILSGPAHLSIGAQQLAAATLTWVMLGCALGALSLFVSAVLGRRAATLAVSAGVALFGYLADSFIPLVAHLGWVRDVSPYDWFIGGDPLRNGLQLGRCGLLLVLTTTATILAAVALNRRDLRV